MQVLEVSFFSEMGALVRVATPVLLVFTVHMGTPGVFRNCLQTNSALLTRKKAKLSTIIEVD